MCAGFLDICQEMNFHDNHFTDDEDDYVYLSEDAVFIDNPNEPIKYVKKVQLTDVEKKNLETNKHGVSISTSVSQKTLKTDPYDATVGCFKANCQAHVHCSSTASERSQHWLEYVERKDLVNGHTISTSASPKSPKLDESYDDVDGGCKAHFQAQSGENVHFPSIASEQSTANQCAKTSRYTIPNESLLSLNRVHNEDKELMEKNSKQNGVLNQQTVPLNLSEEQSKTETINCNSQNIFNDKHKPENNLSYEDEVDMTLDSFDPSFLLDLNRYRSYHDHNKHYSMTEFENYPTSLRYSCSFLNDSAADGESSDFNLKTSSEGDHHTLTPEYCSGSISNTSMFPTSSSEISSISCKTGSNKPDISESLYKYFDNSSNSQDVPLNLYGHEPIHILHKEPTGNSPISLAAPPDIHEDNKVQNSFPHKDSSSFVKAASSSVSKPPPSSHNTYNNLKVSDGHKHSSCSSYCDSSPSTMYGVVRTESSAVAKPPPSTNYTLNNGYKESLNNSGFSNSYQTQKTPEVINIGEMISIADYVEKEWKGTTEKAETIRKAYYHIPRSLNLENIRTIRGDNYCALRSTVFQILANGIAIDKHLGTLQDSLQKIEQFRLGYLKDWNFANRIEHDGQNVHKTVQECVKCLYQQIMACQSNDKDSRQEYLIQLLNRNPEIDLQLLEAVKCLMMIKAIHYYEENIKGSDVPVFVWLLFARDSSETPETFMRNHMNKIGDSSGMEQIEMFLLGYTLGVQIKVVRPYLYEKEDFITHFPDEFRDKWPEVNLIAEEDRHYNVLVS